MKQRLLDKLLKNQSEEHEIDEDLREESLQGFLEQLKGGFSGNYEERYVWCEGPMLFIGQTRPTEFHPLYKLQSVSAQSFRHGGNCFKLIINYQSVETSKPDVTTLRIRDEALFKKWYSCLYFNCYAPMNKKALMDKAGESVNDLSQGKKTLDLSVGMLRFLREAWPGGAEDLMRIVDANSEKQKHKTMKERLTIDSKAAKDEKKWAKLFRCVMKTKQLEITSGVATLGGTEELIHLDLDYFKNCNQLYLDHIRLNTINDADRITKLLLRNTTGDITPFQNVEKLCITETESFDWKLIREMAKTLCIIEIHSFLRDEQIQQIIIGTPGRQMENTDWFRLRILDLSDNAIEFLPKCFEKVPLLERMILDHNDLVSLDGLGNLSTLVYLSAAKNKLTKAAALAACPRLTYIDLSYNQIVDFPWSYVKSCMLIDLSHNSIDSFDGLNALTTNQSLMSLSLFGNHLGNRLDYLPILQVLFKDHINGQGIKLDGQKLKHCNDETTRRIAATYSEVLTYEYDQAPVVKQQSERTPLLAAVEPTGGGGGGQQGRSHTAIEVERILPKKKKVKVVRRKKRRQAHNDDSGEPSPKESKPNTPVEDSIPAVPVPVPVTVRTPPLDSSATELQTKIDLNDAIALSHQSNHSILSDEASKPQPVQEEPFSLGIAEAAAASISKHEAEIMNTTVDPPQPEHQQEEEIVSSPEVMPVTREELDSSQLLGGDVEEDPLASGGSEMFAAAAAPIHLSPEQEEQTLAYIRDSMRGNIVDDDKPADSISSLGDEYELVSLGDDYLSDDIVIPEKGHDRSQLPEDLQNFIALITKPAQSIFGYPALAFSFIIGWYKKYWESIGGRSWAKTQKALVILCHLHLVFVVPFVFIFAQLPCNDCTDEDAYNDQKFRYFISAMVVLSSVFQTAFGIMAIFYENIVMLIAFNMLTVVLAARYIFNVVYYSKDANMFQVLVPPIIEVCFEITYFVTSLLIGPNFNSLVCFRVGGGPHLVRLYKNAQIYSAIAKTDCLFVGLSAIVAGFWYVETTTEWVWWFLSCFQLNINNKNNNNTNRSSLVSSVRWRYTYSHLLLDGW